MKIWNRIVEGATRLAGGESFAALLGLSAPPADDGAHPGLRQMAFTIGVIALGAKMAGADVDDRLRAPIRVRGVVLPGRNPLLHRPQHLVLAEDRIAIAATLAEGGVDEVAVDADPEPEGAIVA